MHAEELVALWPGRGGVTRVASRAMGHRKTLAASFTILGLLVGACCFGGSTPATQATRLEPWGLELTHGTFTGGLQPGGTYLFTSGDGSSTVTISAAAPGGPAASRQPTEIASGQVQWSRPRSYAGLSGMEARLTDLAAGRVHWVGAVDAPGGVVWMHLETSTEWIDTPTRGDPGWETLANGLHSAP